MLKDLRNGSGLPVVLASIFVVAIMVLAINVSWLSSKEQKVQLKKMTTCQEKIAEFYIADVQPYSDAYDYKKSNFNGFAVTPVQTVSCNSNKVEKILVKYFDTGADKLIQVAHHKNHRYVAWLNKQLVTDGENFYINGEIKVRPLL